MQKNIKLNMSRRIRRTPFTNKVEECGVSDFTVVNHMLLPKGFKNSIEEDYWHLSQHVQIWECQFCLGLRIAVPPHFWMCSQDQHAQAQYWLRHAHAQLMHAQAQPYLIVASHRPKEAGWKGGRGDGLLGPMMQGS